MTKIFRDGLQRNLAVSWPPAERIVDRYGYGKEIIPDPDHGWGVPKRVASAVVKAFKAECLAGQLGYPKLRPSSAPCDPQTGQVVKKVTEPGRVDRNELQLRLAVAWPPADRFISKYGFEGETEHDTDSGWTVSEETTAAVVDAHRQELGGQAPAATFKHAG